MPPTAPSRRTLAALSLVLAATLVPWPVAAQEDVRLQGLSGGELRESELRRGNHIVVFWTTWSPRGRDVVARVNAIDSRWGRAARVVTVNFQEDAADVRAFLGGQGRLAVPVYLDTSGSLSKKFRVNSAPWLLVVRDGRTAYSERLPNDPDAVLGEILR